MIEHKAVVAHCPVTQKEVDEPLAKDAIELSFVGARFHCNVSVVPRHMEGL